MVLHVLEAVLAVIAVLLLALVALAVWSRRGEGASDRSGVRTVVTFTGGARYCLPEELEGEQNEGTEALGEGLMRAMRAELDELGMQTQPPGRDDHGWGMRVRLDRHDAYLLLGASVDTDDGWTLMVLDPSSGGPGPVDVLAGIDEALRKTAGIADVAWHDRQSLRESAGDAGRDSPVD